MMNGEGRSVGKYKQCSGTVLYNAALPCVASLGSLTLSFSLLAQDCSISCFRSLVPRVWIVTGVG